jgi:hypothetical protein
MMRIRKKPIEVEGEQIDDYNIKYLSSWCGGIVKFREDNLTPYIMIPTLEGSMRAEKGDWIIKGVNGEFYPCKDSIFKKTYDVITGEKAGDDKIMVDGIVEHEDGSATVTFELSDEMVKTFAKIGLEAVLLESVENFSKEQKNES